ncbi:DUF4118 domain-containing protein [Solirubrobacter ginsenosidimutans]|uniref:histidine kinase n=1 Tax=Solirubrobacter ginsenosidimutans TaxID=490573 RepID=A0A9X3N508_9ACTN|nr:GAF domain-containing protein [Solirubrobacter ginsenosidimutans]MDA0166732.1 DUF4118 domain-containing protein [Solirubrobacter ginsenosidimutans]
MLFRHIGSVSPVIGCSGIACAASDHDVHMMRPTHRRLTGWIVSATLVAAVSGVLELLESDPSASTVAVLYLFAVIPVAIVWGTAFGVLVAVASTLTYDYLFVPPKYSLVPTDPRDWLRLTGFLAAAVVVSELAARWRESARLAAEQAALRRVATLVAEGAAAETVFAAVANEVALLLEVDGAAVLRFDSDGGATVVGSWGKMTEALPVDRRLTLDGDSVTALVYRTARSARFDDYEHASGSIAARARTVRLRSAVGSPILVDRGLWGALVAGTWHLDRLAADAESRVAQFTELVVAAISNVQARSEVQRLADEQAALRRVATIVARECPPEEVFAKVAEEVGRLLKTDAAVVWRYEPGGGATVVGSWGELGGTVPVGRRIELDGDSVTALVYRTKRPARVDAHEHATGSVAADARSLGSRSAVGTPIIVNQRLWGSLGVESSRAEPMPLDAESRMTEFTELVATAISNVQARSELAASRARIVAGADDERRRVVRDLHDGAQQRLVHSIITLKLANRAVQNADDDSALALMAEALMHTERANAELRELAHGILPSALTQGGLRAGVRELASRTRVPVAVDVSVDRLPAAIEATAYFVVAEALTNVAKHARAEHVEVTLLIEDGTLAVQIRDDGVGGARTDGSGLTGLADRLAALDGELRIESPPDGGTVVAAAIPVPDTRGLPATN